MRYASGTLGLKEIVGSVIPHSKKYRENPPKRITDDVLAVLIAEGLAFTVSANPSEAAKQIRKARNRVAILPLEHRKDKETSNRIVKDICPDNYLNMDSAPVVREAVELSRHYAGVAKKAWSVPSGVSIDRMTDKLAEATGMYPYFLQRAAADLRSGQPPLGFYWTGNDKRVRATTWMRCVNGHENYGKSKRGQYKLELADEIYARTIEIIVSSQSNPREKYKYTLIRLPLTSADDKTQYSEWRKFSVIGNIPDEMWRGKVHLKRDTENIFISSAVITGYDAIADRVLRTGEMGSGMEVQINPFPMLTNHGKELVRLLREQTIIGKRGLNMTELDYLIGADTVGGYDKNFVNWRRG